MPCNMHVWIKVQLVSIRISSIRGGILLFVIQAAICDFQAGAVCVCVSVCGALHSLGTCINAVCATDELWKTCTLPTCVEAAAMAVDTALPTHSYM